MKLKAMKMRWMTTMINRLFLVFMFTSAGFRLLAQHTDAATWLSAGVNVDLTKDLALDAGEEMRYNISVGDLYQWNTNLGLTYAFTKKIKAGLDYRYSIRSTKSVNRIGASLLFREGIQDFDFSLKTRLQYSFIPDQSEGSTWRNKGTIKYEGMKDLTPYFSAELFYSFSNTIDQLDDYRLELGFKWELSKHHDLTLFYLFDREFNVNDPVTLNVFGISYVYNL